MATPRKSPATAKAAPSPEGAASAVAKDTTTTVEQDAPITVDAADVSRETDAPVTEVDAPVDEPITDAQAQAETRTPLRAFTQEAVDAALAQEVKPRDMAALARLADTSGGVLTTPYPAEPGVTAPAPTRVLPEVRSTFNWTSDGDKPRTGRVLVDGWRARINGSRRFAQLGDRVTAPEDLMTAAAARGTVHLED